MTTICMFQRAVFLMLATVASCLHLVAAAHAAPADPVWSINATSHPTNFTPESAWNDSSGPLYLIRAVNVGGSGTVGNFTVVDTLPPGVTLSSTRSPSGEYGDGGLLATPMICGSVGQVVTCEGGPGTVHPSQAVRVTIPVELSAEAPAEVANTVTISGGGAAGSSVTTVTRVEDTPAPFGLMEGSNAPRASAIAADGAAVTQAGSHPFGLSIGLNFPSVPPESGQTTRYGSAGGVRDVEVILPSGVAINPAATRRCKEQDLNSATGCPDAAQVGVAEISVGLSGVSWAPRPLYNMMPPPGSPGAFAFEALEGIYVHLIGHVDSEGRYELSANANDLLAKIGVFGARTTLWGNPTSASYDPVRGACNFEVNDPDRTCPVTRQNLPFVTLPSACSQSLEASVRADAWEAPGVFDERTFSFIDLAGDAIGIEGCSALDFEPTIALEPDATRTDTPTGLEATLHIPQKEEYEDESGNIGIATSTLRDAKVTLPAGFTVNPAAANGRTACTAAQIGLKTPIGQVDARFSGAPAACPDAAKIGSVEVESPLLQDEPEPGVQVPHPLPGSIYLAQPFENPFDSLLAIYIAISDPQTGIVLKLPGEVEADPVTGQLTTTFKDNPQLPFEDFRLQFFDGPRAALRTPAICGDYEAKSELSPWSGTAPVAGTETFSITEGADGAPCVGSPQQLPHSPTFEAGTSSPLAGVFAPFVMRLERRDGSQELGGIDLTLPPGLTGKLAGTPYCPDAALAGAEAKTGREELDGASCPLASQVGTVTVGAGAGSAPVYVQGKAYLAGPYEGEPLSLAIVTPAVAGPFDLGTVVVRAALHLDLFSAQISVKSDPLPTILEGIPLDIRSIAVAIDKPEFTLNPTSCEPMSIGGTAIGTAGAAAPLAARFQADGCGGLGFRPKLKLSLKGATKRAGHPALKAVVTYPAQGAYANIASAQVSLPKSEFLDQGNLDNVCTQPQLKSRTCPARSIYGRVKAWTPLLAEPLEGNAYLGVGFGHRLPDLVAELNGQIRVLLHGKVDTNKAGGLRNTFETVPDAPVTKFVLEMQGGKKKGLLTNSENICRRVNRARVKFVAQNGKVHTARVPIATSCRGGSGKKAR